MYISTGNRWLFIFKIIDEINENDKRKLCVSKVDYYLNNAIIQVK